MRALLQYLKPPHRLGALLACLVCAPVLLYTAHTLNYHNQNTRIEADAGSVSRDIGQQFSEIRTLMASLVGLHYASSELNNSALLLFTEELRKKAPYITGIGRYERIAGNQRSEFESHMSQTGLFGLEVTQINDNGRTSIRPDAKYYYPISMFEPMALGNLQLLGADLATVPGLQDQLDLIAKRNGSLLSSMPDNWPNGGDLMLFRPVYRAKRAPQNPLSRTLKSAGGFWITIDMATLLKDVSAEQNEFDLSVKLVDDHFEKLLYSRVATQSEPLYFSSLYKRKTFTEQWPSTAKSLVITLHRELGYSANTLLGNLAILGVLLLMGAMLMAHIANKRTRMRDRQRDRYALFKEREKAEKTLNSVQDSIITLDENYCIAHINPAAVIQFSAKPSNTVGRPLNNIIQFQLVDDTFGIFNVEAALANVAHNGEDEFDVVPVDHARPDCVLRLTLTSTRSHSGDITGHILVLRDISHEHRLTLKLEYQANHDALTGCSNRYYFEQTLANLIEKLPTSGLTHALCYMDLDQFKVINDTCGHCAGDQLLTELTENMMLIIREGDVLSRLGGDEFGLLMIDVSSEDIQAITQRVFEFFQNYVFYHEEKAFAVRASIGVVHIDQSCNSIKDVLASADIACYAAKDSGRNSMYVYSKTDDTMAERSVELSWLPRLQNALQNDEFRLHVQAVASVSSQSTPNSVEHFEFLLRLANSDGSESTPWKFIQAAERYDLMREIDKWVIRNSLSTVAELSDSVGGNCSFSINLSGQSAADPTLKDYIREQLLHYKVDPSHIWFELTETAAISHFSVALDLIKSIRDLGAKVALDDFGSGLSSFGYLKNLPVDIIKIDGQFIKEIANNPIDREMVRAIHQVGKSMGIVTVAEFVEDQAILDELASIGIDYAQGYHIGKPCNIKEAMNRLESNQSKAA